MQVLFENRWAGYKGDVCTVYVDGKDFKTNKVLRFTRAQCRKWYSHKYKHFAVKYEIASCINTGHVVHYSGPYRGAVPDITIFRFFLKKNLASGEKAMANLGYRGDRKIVTSVDAVNAQHARAMKAIGGRHETINGRLCTFEAMRQCWRHDLSLHHIAFRGCLVLVQLSISHGRPVYSIRGYTHPIDSDEESVVTVESDE